MKWFKFNMPIKDSGEILGAIRTILSHIKKADQNKISCYTKVANDGSINVFVTEEIIKSLPGILRLEYNLQKCAPPSKKSDEEGSSLIYQFGYSHIPSNPEGS